MSLITNNRRGHWPTFSRSLPVILMLGALTFGAISCKDSYPATVSTARPRTFTAATQPATAPSIALHPAVAAEAKHFAFPPALDGRTDAQRIAGSVSCVACHAPHDSYSMHIKEQRISCVDCHGGDPDARVHTVIAGLTDQGPAYEAAKREAHVNPKLPELWKTAANPNASGAATLQESADYIRFVNPGDLRAAMVSCGACHRDEVEKVRTSMMAHGAMLWGAALYNNGAINRKNPVFGEFYTPDGEPARVVQNPGPTTRQADQNGILTSLSPLPRWEISQPGNPLRVFERGGKIRPQLGIPEIREDAGRPDVKLSLRDFGTDVRTDPVFLGLQKTRLMDPTLNLVGTNDHPGDYRASGCSACHVVYANDRSPIHSGQMFAKFGNRGESFSLDPAVNPVRKPATQPVVTGYEDPWDERRPTRQPGQPIAHRMVRNMPTSTCISCHIHPGTNVVNAYLGFMWWDNETDGKTMYPKGQQDPSEARQAAVSAHNPEGSASRGLWSNQYPNEADHTGAVAGPNFLEKLGTPEFNKRLTRTQFADFHGHGWVYRAVFKQDRHGNILDYKDDPVPPHDPSNPKRFNDAMAAGVAFQSTQNGARPPAGVPVHLKDIHLERGMHCVDCHFSADSHGNGNLYGETRNAVHINCEDCHGTTERKANIFAYLLTREGIEDRPPAERDKLLAEALTGNAAAATPELARERNKKLVDGGSARFSIDTQNRLVQSSALDPNVKWPVPQTADTVDPASWWSKARKDAGADKPVPVAGGNAAPAASAKAPVVMGSVGKPAGDGKSAPQAGPLNGKVTPMGATTRPAEVDHATLARYAHTVRKDAKSWGTIPTDEAVAKCEDPGMAHGASRMSCYACHTSWNTSCFGCHLPMKANQKTPMLHNEGLLTRNYTNYNYQTLRDDVYMLGLDSTAKGHKIVPIRSACAVLVSSTDANRQVLYQQQQTVSAEGFSGTAFSPYFPHTVRATETKHCSDCHISKANDNNAIMAQLMLQGTNSVNFIGRFAWVGMGDGGLAGVAVTERNEPQAVIGSTLHEIAYPDDYRKHVEGNKRELQTAHDHHGVVLDLQLRGEYLYTACGPDGFIAYDVANIDNKGFSERIVTAPVSPLGQRLFVKSKYATSITSPSTMAIDPTRPRLQIEQKLSDGSTRTLRPNEEGKITEIGDPSKVIDPNRGIHPLYAYLYLTDREEGLIVIGNPADSKNKAGIATLLDGDPANNFLERAVTFNPGGLLKGARHLALHGTHAYVSCDAGLVVIDLNDPLNPKHVPTSALSGLSQPRKVAFQFRYGFVCDDLGVRVIDVTFPDRPTIVRDAAGRPVTVPVLDARDIYLSRTFAYVAAGREGLVILDIERPEQPRWLTVARDFASDFNAAGQINDATAVRIGMTNASMFAYVADGRNGLKVLQLTSPEDTPTYLGFSPRLNPRLIATHKTHGPAISLSEGLDRDRAADEAGNQLSVFGRKGARPFTLEEMQKLYLRGEGAKRAVYTVSDVPETEPLKPAAGAAASPAAAPAPAADPPKAKPRLPFGPRR